LLKIGFVGRTRQGRIAAPDAYKHLGLRPPAGAGKTKRHGRPDLFDVDA
jgi:hypothetical protein